MCVHFFLRRVSFLGHFFTYDYIISHFYQFFDITTSKKKRHEDVFSRLFKICEDIVLKILMVLRAGEVVLRHYEHTYTVVGVFECLFRSMLRMKN